jgi:hypothetical protein
MENETESENVNPNSEIIFAYKGRIYNRPLGRGICLKDDGEYEQHDIYLEEAIPTVDFEIEIIVRKIIQNDLAGG